MSCSILALGACNGDSGTGTDDGGTTTTDCSTATTHIEQVVCASNAFLATLTEEQKASVLYAWTNQVAKTYWSNLPGVTRNGLKVGHAERREQGGRAEARRPGPHPRGLRGHDGRVRGG